MKRILFALLSLLILLSACSPAPATPPLPAKPGQLYIDPTTELGPISPYLYGSNYGPWTAVPFEMLPAAFDSGITVLRWPGGAWGDQNVIQTYQLDQFMDFCNQMGAIPTISVNLRDGTPEQAAELVRYANIEKGYDIQYWSIGNEPTLYAAELQETYDTERYNPRWRAFAEAMKAVDPEIQLMGPELHQWGTNAGETLKDSSGRDWMIEFLKANGDLVDIVTVHRYPLWTSGQTRITTAQMRQNTLEWPRMVQYLRSLIQEHTGRELPIAFTEVNSTPTQALGGPATPDSFYNAIWYAEVVGHLIDEQVFMLNHFVLAHRNGGLGLIRANEIRPTYYTFQLYRQFGEQQVYADSGVEWVSVYAAERTDGAITVMIVNLNESQQQVSLQIEGWEPQRMEVWRLDGEHQAENLGHQPFPPDGSLNLPGPSVTLLVLP